MPTLGVHFPDDEAKAVEAAALASQEEKVGPYIAEAVRQRMAREGTLPGNPKAELFAAADEVGGVENAVAVLRRSARRKTAATA